MTRGKFALFLVGMLTILLGTGAGAAWAQGPGATVVRVSPVIERELSAGQTFVGTVMPLKKAIIGSAVDGRVIEFPVNEGDRIAKGQTLAQLLTETISLELEAAEAELRLREQELLELQNGSRPEEIEQARAKMQAAKATMEYRQARLQRTQSLFQQGRAVTEEQFEEAQSVATEARELYQEAKAVYDLAVKGPRPERIAQAKAQVAMQRAVAERLRDQIKKHTIISRFDGYVIAEHTEIGQWVNRGEPVAEVIALDSVDVEAHVLESHIPFIPVGTTARVEIPALPNEAFTGEVVLVVPQADVRSRTFPVKVRLENVIENDNPLIKAGMLARVTLPTGARQKALLVPKDALVLGGEQPLLWVVDPQTVETVKDPNSGQERKQAPVQGVPVRLGVADGELIQVEGNLRKGHLVVVRGNERIMPPRPGQPSIVQWSPATEPTPIAGSAGGRAAGE